MRSLPNTGLNIYIPIMLSRSEEMTTGWVRGSTDPLGDGLVLKSHWSPEFPKPTPGLVAHSDVLGLLELVLLKSEGAVVPEMCDHFQCSYPGQSQKYLRERLDRLIGKVFASEPGSFLKGNWNSLF